MLMRVRAIPERIKWYACFEEERPFTAYPVSDIFYWRPKIKKTRLCNGVWIEEEENVFEGYCFIGSVRGWRYIEQLLELELLRSNGEPYEFSEAELQALRFYAQVHFNLIPERFRQGERVKVSESSGSSFAGLNAVVVQSVPAKGGEQVCVELNFFDQRTISQCLPLDHLVRR